MDLPSEQNAAIKTGSGPETKVPVKRIPVSQEPGPGQILVNINWTGLCASDKSILYDETAPLWCENGRRHAGDRCARGCWRGRCCSPGVENLWKIGDRAGVRWVAHTCRKCEFCTNGMDELQCPKQLNSGLTTPGTFQEYCPTDGRYATR